MRRSLDNQARRLEGRRSGILFVSFVVLVLLATTARRAASQTVDNADFQTWVDLATIYSINDRLLYIGDQGVRRSFSDRVRHRVYVRPSVRYDVRSWLSLHGGLGLSYTFQSGLGNSLELRPWQGLRFYWPRPGGFGFGHYLRFEQRNEYSTRDDEWDTVVRARYQLRAKSPLFTVANNEDVYSHISIEFFDDVSGPKKQEFIDRIRFVLGVGDHIGKNWRLETHYLFQISKPSSGSGFETKDHVLRIRLFCRFN